MSRSTYADLEKLPENMIGELIGEVLYASPRPAPVYALAKSSIGADLGTPFHRGRGGPGGWWILDEPELHFGMDVLVPDVAGWRRERMSALPKTAAFELPPDWVCEVISPSTARLDRSLKMAIYARVRVPHLWIVDPVARTLEIYALDEDSYRVVHNYGGDDKVRAVPFDAIELELAGWWESPLP